jgi:DNA-binding XRE family transcriptional regulator
MNKQIIKTPAGERMVVIPEAEYQALVEAADDAADAEVVREFRRRLAAGEEELIPAEFVDRLLDGENPVRVWRDFRGMTAAALAKKAGIARPYLTQVETGKRDGTVATMRRIAKALGVSIDDLV